MIVPMKKVSLIIMGDKKTETLKTLRKLGMIHIEIDKADNLEGLRLDIPVFAGGAAPEAEAAPAVEEAAEVVAE